MKRQLFSLAASLLVGGAYTHALMAADQTLLLRTPDISKDQLAFVYAGDIWVASREGKEPRRLTSSAADESRPVFSPDGKWIAFTADYNGNTDAYVISADGGQPKRLTYHPDDDVVTGWSPDGKEVLFTSPREVAVGRSQQLYRISASGGYPAKVMDAPVTEADYAPDGKSMAYRPYIQAYRGSSGWRQHRGGTTPPIWIYDFDAKSHVEIPHVNASDLNPIWLGKEVYFLSDRADGAVNLFRYEGQGKAPKQLTENTVWDIRSARGFGDAVAYEPVAGSMNSIPKMAARMKSRSPSTRTCRSFKWNGKTQRVCWKAHHCRPQASAQFLSRVVIFSRYQLTKVPRGTLQRLTVCGKAQRCGRRTEAASPISRTRVARTNW